MKHKVTIRDLAKAGWGFGHDGIADFKRQGAALQPSYTAASLGTARSDELRS